MRSPGARMRFGRLRVLRIEGIVPATSSAWGLGYTAHSFNGVSRKAVSVVTTQLELEARYTRVVSAKAAAFVYADHVASLCAHSGVMGSGDVLIDMIGGAGLRVADVRSVAADVHDAGGWLFADITVPSHFGCHAFDLGVDVQLEGLDRIAAGCLSRKVVAVSSRGVLPVAGDRLSAADLDAIAQGLDSAPERMQRHFDHARALAEYLSCCEGLGSVAYPGLLCHPDHDLATRVLMHGFGPAVDFELPEQWGVTAGEFIERCELNGRARPAGGRHTRLHARDGADGRAVRIFAGLDNPLVIADDLDQAMRWFCNPPEP